MCGVIYEHKKREQMTARLLSFLLLIVRLFYAEVAIGEVNILLPIVEEDVVLTAAEEIGRAHV